MVGSIGAIGISPSSYGYLPALSAQSGNNVQTGSVTAGGEIGNEIPKMKSVSRAECQTCKNRKYVDGSDEMVSFKAPANISPEESLSKVRSHEQEHVNNAFSKAAKTEGGKVLQASVSLKMAICPECGTSYVAGGTTTTKIAYEENNPYSQNQKSANRDALLGANVDVAV